MLPADRPRGRLPVRRARAPADRGARAADPRRRRARCSVTASLGAAALPESAAADKDALVAAADAALYRAKRAGKNRIGQGRGSLWRPRWDCSTTPSASTSSSSGAAAPRTRRGRAPGARGASGPTRRRESAEPERPRRRRRAPPRPGATSRRRAAARPTEAPRRAAEPRPPAERAAARRRAGARRAEPEPPPPAAAAERPRDDEPWLDEPDEVAAPHDAAASHRRRGRRTPGRGRTSPRTSRGRGRARGDAGVPAGDAGARPAVVRAEAAARLRLRRVAGWLRRPPLHLAGRLHVASACRQRARGRPRRRRRRRRDDARASRARRGCRRRRSCSRPTRRRRLPPPHLDDDRRDPVRRPPVARHRGGGRARPRRDARRPTSRRRTPGLQPIDVEVDGDRARASMLQEPAAFGDELDPGEVLGARRPRGGRRRPRPAAAGRLHRRAAGDRAACATPARCGRAVARLRRASARCSAAHGGDRRSTSPPSTRRRDRARALASSARAEVGEDPATGSAAGPLMAHVAARTGVRAARRSSRASRWAARACCAPRVEGDRVRVGGDAVVVVDGHGPPGRLIEPASRSLQRPDGCRTCPRPPGFPGTGGGAGPASAPGGAPEHRYARVLLPRSARRHGSRHGSLRVWAARRDRRAARESPS